jgi:hypothetical protein
LAILDEKEYAENLIKNGSKTPYVPVKDLTYLAKYYRFLNKGTHEIRLLLEKFCYDTNKDYNPVLTGWKVVSALNTIKRYRLRTSFPIVITKAEVDAIKKWKDYSYQKILFLLIVMGKFLKYSNVRINPSAKTRLVNDFYVKDKIPNIFKTARVSIRTDKQYDMLYEFRKAGILYYTHYDSLKILCIDETSEPEIIVTDINDPVLFWQRYMGEKIAACSKCGKLFVKRSNRHTMCRGCFQEQRREKQREYTKKYRDNVSI